MSRHLTNAAARAVIGGGAIATRFTHPRWEWRPHIPSHARGTISGAHPQSAAWERSIADPVGLFCRRLRLQERQKSPRSARTHRSFQLSLHVALLPISWSHVDVPGLPVGEMGIV